jgi:hypothetical protein
MVRWVRWVEQRDSGTVHTLSFLQPSPVLSYFISSRGAVLWILFFTALWVGLRQADVYEESPMYVCTQQCMYVDGEIHVGLGCAGQSSGMGRLLWQFREVSVAVL